MDEHARALSALTGIEPGCDRKEWVRIGMAAKAAGLSFDDFVAWSRPAHNFVSERDCNAVWKSFTDGPITAATLFAAASAAGWDDSTTMRRQNGYSDAKSPHHVAPQTLSAADLWSRCEPATSAHPYIIAKLGLPDGLRVVPTANAPTIAGASIGGWLAAPVRSLDGDLRTLQFIPPPGIGKKLNLPGASFGDGLFVVGELNHSDRICIVEGIGQAWACQRATGQAAAVCFGAGRMEAVAFGLRHAFPKKRLTLVADRGKEEQAETVARAIHGDWAGMPDDKPSTYDAADFAAEFGTERLAGILANAKTPTLRYRILTAGDVRSMPPLTWLVRGVLPSSGLSCIFGASGAGKSFVALDMCAAVASGSEWFGRRVSHAPVVYAALEGEHGFRQRVTAWETYHGRRLPEQLRFVMQSIDLRNPADITELGDAVIASGCEGGLLVIDTLNRAASGADENSSADMGALIDAAKALQARLSGVVLLIHHTGKDATKGLRGHSSLHAALDAAIEVIRNDDRREWRIAKAKDDADSLGHPFRLEVVEIETDEDGELVTSCVVVEDDQPTVGRLPKIPKGGNQRIVWDALGELLKRSEDYSKGGAPSYRPCVELERAVVAIAPRLTCEPKRRSERTREALTGLITRKLVECREGWLWLP